MTDGKPKPSPVQSSSRPASSSSKTPTSESLQQTLRRLQAGKGHRDLLVTRQELPVFKFRQNILELVARSSVVVIAGETGSGKSTQVPQFILEVREIAVTVIRVMNGGNDS